MFKCMPFLNACNRDVDYIDRRHSNLIAIPDDVLRYTRTLEELLLDANQIRELPRGLYRLCQLRKLTVSDNEIGRVSQDIGQLINLQELDISRNDIEEFPDTIKFCKELQVVDFSGNPLQKLPDGFTQLRHLTRVGLNDVMLTRLPVDFGSLTNLQTLELRENLLKTLPPSISSLTKLQTLDLGSNMFEELPAAVCALSNLEELLLDINELNRLPEEIGCLKHLSQLDVSENKLLNLPEGIGQLSNLVDLFISQNQIDILPESIGNLKKLCILKADQNQLVRLTPNIGSCESLQELILTENLLSDLPVTIGQLKALSNFNVDKNRLHDLPNEIGGCIQLSVLSLRDNQIGTLPDMLGNLHQLHVLDVSGNRLHHLPLSLGTCSLKAIWLSENQAQPLLNFQEDLDEETGVKVLTCFLLPQQAYHTGSMENLLKGSVTTDRDSQLSWAGGDHASINRPAVKFAVEEEVDAGSDDDETNFVRHDTPHPKELRTRHSRLMNKGVDGHVIPRNPDKEKGTVSFMPSRDSTWSQQPGTASPHSPSSPSAETAPFIKGPSPRISSPVKQDSSVATPTITISTEVAFIEKADAAAEMIDEEAEAYEDAQQNPDDDDNMSNRHVGFSLDDDFIERESKLRRRDTPHHLKNKRISGSGVGKVESEEEKVLRILALVAAGNSQPSSGRPSATSEHSLKDEVDRIDNIASEGQDDKVFDSESTNDEKENLLPRVTFPADRPSIEKPNSASEVVNTVPPAPAIRIEQLSLDSLHKSGEEISVRIARQPGTGLGISIAGGIGSSPYKDNDEGVFISRVSDGGPCHMAGLQVGDKLIAVNGRSMIGIEHHRAVAVLKEAGVDITMTVVKPPTADSTSSPQCQLTGSKLESNKTVVTMLHKDQNGLGFSIVGGTGKVPVNYGDEAVMISKIIEGGVAERDGKLRVGDQIISINGVGVTSASHDQVVALLTSPVTDVTIVVYRDSFEQPPNHGYTVIKAEPEPEPVPVSSVVRVERGPVLRPPPSPPSSQPPVDISVSSSPFAASPAALQRTETSPPKSVIYTVGNDSTSEPPNMKTVFPELPTAQTSAVVSVQPVTDVRHQPLLPSVMPSSDGVADLFNALERNYVQAQYKPSPASAGNFTPAEPYPVEDVSIVKTSGSLGLSIVGGSDHTCHPFGQTEPGLFISKIVPLGAASRSRLRFGDRILSVNGHDVRHATHHEAIRYLTAPGSEVIIQVRHDPPPAGLQEVEVFKRSGETLGISIRGGTKSKSGHPLDTTDEGIFISKILPGGTVDRNGKLRVGQRILEVNGQSLLGVSHQEAVHILRSVSSRFVVLVCDGFDQSLVDVDLSLRNYGSLSSIDCDSEELARRECARRGPSSPQTQFAAYTPGTPPLLFTNAHTVSGSSIASHQPTAGSASPASSPFASYTSKSQLAAASRPPVAVKAWKSPTGAVRSFDATVDADTDADYVDPLKQSKLPAARLKPVPTIVAAPVPQVASVPDREVLAFNLKREFFQREIEQQSQLQPKPIAGTFSAQNDDDSRQPAPSTQPQSQHGAAFLSYNVDVSSS